MLRCLTSMPHLNHQPGTPEGHTLGLGVVMSMQARALQVKASAALLACTKGSLQPWNGYHNLTTCALLSYSVEECP